MGVDSRRSSIRVALEDYLAGLRGLDSNFSLVEAERLGEFALGELDSLEEQYGAEHGLAEVLRRLLTKSHSLEGLRLTVGDVTVALTDAEFELVWDALDAIDGEDFMLRAVSSPAREPG